MIRQAMFIVIFAAACGGQLCHAHDSPEHVIEAINHRMAREGPSVDLLQRRASEYRVLGQLEQAAADLRHAIRIDATHLGACTELARILSRMGMHDDALAAINGAIDLAPQGRSHAYLYATRGSVLASAAELRAALTDYDLALSEDPDEIDWYLARARLHRQLGQDEQRIAGLLAGYRATQSGVLHAWWIDALLQGKDPQAAAAALVEIEHRLEALRLKSTWLIRRGRARLILGQAAAARIDLETALHEISGRLHPKRPDPSLLLDRAMAHYLLGDIETAKTDVDLVATLRVHDDRLAELQTLMTPAAQESATQKDVDREGEER